MEEMRDHTKKNEPNFKQQSESQSKDTHTRVNKSMSAGDEARDDGIR